MLFDLMMKLASSRCVSNNDLYGRNCKHLMLCSSCSRNTAEIDLV
ncbi:hypothetical protein SOVF_169120 [Spinacia oleracea]|nr:hypothetical protein SOVF_169120 [Spinacia oleracea]